MKNDSLEMSYCYNVEQSRFEGYGVLSLSTELELEVWGNVIMSGCFLRMKAYKYQNIIILVMFNIKLFTNILLILYIY